MVSVIIAVVGTLGAVLTALVPTLLTSERRQLLRFVTEESSALEAVTDEQAKDHLRRALRATSRRYHQLARQTKSERRGAQLVSFFTPLYILFVVGGCLVLFRNYVGDSERSHDASVAAGLVLLLLSLFTLAVLFARLTQARNDERRESRKLAAERERRAQAESAVDQVQDGLKRLRSASSGTTSLPVHEIQRLLEMLDESKAARRNWVTHNPVLFHPEQDFRAKGALAHEGDGAEGDDEGDAGVPAKT